MGARGAQIHAAALWVHLDPATGVPQRLNDRFEATFGVSAAGRRVSARLQHPPAPVGAEAPPWVPRWCDLDVLGHVNNAAYWTAVLDQPAARENTAPYLAEIEHRAPVSASQTLTTPVAGADDGALRVWFVSDDVLCASAMLRSEPAQPGGLQDDGLSGDGGDGKAR